MLHLFVTVTRLRVIVCRNLVTLFSCSYLTLVISRRFVFTINNPEGLLLEEDFIALGASYMVYQTELGEQGTLHFQGYLEFPKPVRRSHIARTLPTAHTEPARGTGQQCEDYCTKEETRMDGPYRYGTRSRGAGSRTDILALRDAVRDGKRDRELFEDDAVAGAAIRYCRGVDRMVAAYDSPPMREDVRVILHFGPPGTGKTHCAHSPKAFYYDGSQGEFWIGYNGEDTVILDEFGGHVLRPLMFQRLCDKYPLWLPIKGGQVPCKV